MTVAKLSNNGSVLTDMMGEAIALDGVQVQSVHLPATAPQCQGPNANTPIDWDNTSADQNIFRGRWMLKHFYPQICRFLGL